MLGLAGSITPRSSGNILIVVSGMIEPTGSGTTSGLGIAYQISYGTGVAPSNQGALAGTQVGSVQFHTNDVNTVGTNANHPFSLQAVVTGLTIGTAYWVDLAATEFLLSNGFALANITISVIEIAGGGTSGTSGTQGTSGTSGTSSVGTSGTSATSVTSGTSGSAGSSGSSGSSATSGTSGTGNFLGATTVPVAATNGTFTFDFSWGNGFSGTMSTTGHVMKFQNPTEGQVYRIRIVQAATGTKSWGAGTVGWPLIAGTNGTWLGGGTAGTCSSAASANDAVTVWYVNGFYLASLINQ